MINVMRNKLGPKVIGGIIAVIAGIFVFSGVLVPGSGSQAPSVAGEVNGETISFSEFSRSLNQRIEFFKGMMGGKFSEEQLSQFKIREAVFQDLAQKKLMSQIAKKEGFYPSINQIRQEILKMPVFQKDGHFDKLLYKNVLVQNQYSPTRFEELVGTDLMEQNFREFIGSLVKVTSSEVEQSLADSKNKRKIKYLYVDHESLRKLMPPSKDPKTQPNLDQFTAEFEKKLLPLVNSGSDASIGKLLNDTKTKLKVSEWLNNQSDLIPGVGSIRTVKDQLFAMKKGEPAQALRILGGTLFAKVSDLETYDPVKVTEKEKSETYTKILNQKQGQVFGELMKNWTKNAKITRNDRVVVGSGGGHVPVTLDD
jgi:hypothetical protein